MISVFLFVTSQKMSFFECREEIDNINKSMCDVLTKCRHYDKSMDDPINQSVEVNFDIDIDPDSILFNAIKANCKYYKENNLKHIKIKACF